MSLAPGTRLGAYEVLALIGAGGMGEVYRARDSKLNRDVALKILPDAFASDPERLALFDRSNFLFNYRFHSYSVSPDGKRFLMIQRDPGSVPRQLNVILNWSSALDRPVPDGRRDERGQ
jgi:serine/threonine protein kinase